MESHALFLYNSSRSHCTLSDGDIPIESIEYSSDAPLAILPPPSLTSSGGNSMISTGRSFMPKSILGPPPRPTVGVLGVKRKATDIEGTRSSSANTSSFYTANKSFPYTVVGVDLPNGGRGKGLMKKPAKAAPTPMPTNSSAPLRIPRAVPRKASNVFESQSGGSTPLPTKGSSSVSKAPSLAALSARVNSLEQVVNRLVKNVEGVETENSELRRELDSFRLSFRSKLTRVANAAKAGHALGNRA